MSAAGGFARLAAGALLLAIGTSSLGACAATTGPSPANAAGASARLVPRGSPAPADEAVGAEVAPRGAGTG